ncbi:phage tail protein [Enterococcus casseliflavus]|uniref:phage tail protein n=1 Tax=Enterococcus casseliflavus TaxID=37734 RepID=UPI00339628A3
MAETYGFSTLSTRVLKTDLTPDTSKQIRVLEGKQKEGGPTAFDLTGLSKEIQKVFAGNREYWIAAKGTGTVAANFGLLDVPVAIEQELLGLVTFGDDGGIDGFGDKTEPPYVATVAEAEDLYGEPVAFAMLAGKFNRDGYSLATKNDEDFVPEAGEYVFNAITRDITIGEKTEKMKVLRAFGAANVASLKTAVLGGPVTPPGGGGQ